MRRLAVLLPLLAACAKTAPVAEPAPEPVPPEAARAAPSGTPEPAPIVHHPDTVIPREEPEERAVVEQQAAPRPEIGKYDPPATLGHLATTPQELRKEIDDLVAILFDPQSGREVHEAKAKLAAIGKPAFLPVLGRMAAVRDTITDDDTFEERLIESSLMLADQCLREMDGYLDAKDKAVIRPGTDRRYIKYILVLHYRRWLDGLGEQPLNNRNEMPGPFDPNPPKPN